MKRITRQWLPAALWLVLLVGRCAHAELTVLIIEGLGGEAKYTQEFDAVVKALRAASATATTAEHIQVLSGAGATQANLSAVFKQLSSTLSKDDRLAVYLVGHGSYDGYEYKFNLPGPDLSASQLAKWLGGVKAEHQLVLATGSSSGALQEVLKKDERVIITATRSGNERNATHFGRLLADAVQDAAVDTDKNGRITTQEVFDLTARKVKDYFVAESRLATEHAQLTGAQASVFAMAQLADVNEPKLTATNAPLLAERQKVNEQLDALRLNKEALGEDQYLKQLEPLLLKLAELDAQLAAPVVAPVAAPEAKP